MEFRADARGRRFKYDKLIGKRIGNFGPKAKSGRASKVRRPFNYSRNMWEVAKRKLFKMDEEQQRAFEAEFAGPAKACVAQTVGQTLMNLECPAWHQCAAAISTFEDSILDFTERVPDDYEFLAVDQPYFVPAMPCVFKVQGHSMKLCGIKAGLKVKCATGGDGSVEPGDAICVDTRVTSPARSARYSVLPNQGPTSYMIAGGTITSNQGPTSSMIADITTSVANQGPTSSVIAGGMHKYIVC